MTNAEKLAKDTDRLSKWLCSATGMCKGNNCQTCKFSKICTDAAAMKEWLESEAEEEELAVWNYDNFPYMKIGKVKYKNADGTVEIDGYDGMRFKPMKIIPYDETLIRKFNVILEGHHKAQHESEIRTICNLKTLLRI